jgi:tetratricopeptide (TPR) repeat protein
MKQLYISALFLISSLLAKPQGNEDAVNLVREGITLHDRGEYDAAIAKYEAAIKLDKNLFDAWYEKIFSLFEAGKKKECISVCKDVLKKFPDNSGLRHVYVQYGSALDDNGKSKDALEVYDEGISKFPGEYLLHFNRALTLQRLGRESEALIGYQSALKLKPLHSSSNLYTGMILQQSNKIPALLAYATFLAIEPRTKRSEDAFHRVENIMGSNVKKEGNNTTITLDASTLLGGTNDKNAENNFRSIELIFSLSSALDNNKSVDSIAQSPADKLSLKLQLLINSLAEKQKESKGFYWEHYVPFFADMKEKNHVGTLARLMYMQTGGDENTEWLEKNDKDIEAFYDWVKAYKWN